MISFFSVMIYVTSIIAIVVTLVFYAGILMSNKNISSGQVYTSCSAQLKTCKVSSVVLFWFIGSVYLVYPKRNALRVMLHCQRFVPDLDVFGLFLQL